jgi:hypothetical protein
MKNATVISRNDGMKDLCGEKKPTSGSCSVPAQTDSSVPCTGATAPEQTLKLTKFNRQKITKFIPVPKLPPPVSFRVPVRPGG